MDREVFIPLTVDSTNAEALLIRKASDIGDVFTVDTLNDVVSVAAQVRASDGSAP